MERTFFFSYSEPDAQRVQEIALLVGKDNCWLYQWEAKLGESIFTFDRAIADSRVFVLFWSIKAHESHWVNEEVSQARVRLSRDKGFRFVVVTLDNTALPLHLAHRLCIDAKEGVKNIAEKLRAVQTDLTPEDALLGKAILKDAFQDRQRELDRIEELSRVPEYSGIMVLGPDGMGKTSLVKRSIARVFTHLTPIWVDLKTASTPVRLLASIARPLSITLDPENVARDPVRVWRETLLPEISDSDSLFLVFDNMVSEVSLSSSEPRTMVSLINEICTDLAELHKKDNPNHILVCWTRPNFASRSLARYSSLSLGALDEKSMVRGLRFHLSHTSSMDYKSDKLEQLARQLRGYPLAMNLAATLVAERGIDAVIADTSSIRSMFAQQAQELFSRISLTPEEKRALLFVATSLCPLSSDQLKTILGSDWASLTAKISEKQLLDPTSQGYALHAILRDYVTESMGTPKDIMRSHGTLADLFNSEWKRAPETSAASAEYGSLAYFHNVAAGRPSQAYIIKIAYLEEAKEASVELYRRGQYETALRYLQNVKKIDARPDPIYDFYHALCLSRSDKATEALPIMKDLSEKFPEVSRYHHGLGTVFRRLHRDDEAADAFMTAIATASRRAKDVPLCSLADLLCKLGRYKEAIPLVREALEIAPTKSFVVAAASDVYEKANDIPAALEIVKKALTIFPSDARLHHRAGMLLKRLGRLVEARDHLEQAVADPALGFSYTALADVYLQLGKIENAEGTLEKIPGRKMDNPGYLSTKGNILRLKKDFKQSDDLLRRAIMLEPDNPVHYGGLAQLKLEQAHEALAKGEKNNAVILLREAKAHASHGLEKQGNNEGLLSIKHSIEQCEQSISLG